MVMDRDQLLAWIGDRYQELGAIIVDDRTFDPRLDVLLDKLADPEADQPAP